MTWQPDCGAPPPDPNDPAFLAATEWMRGTVADVDRLVAGMEKRAQEDLAEGVRGVRPHIAVLVREGPDSAAAVHMYVLDVPFKEAHEKRAAMREIGRRLYAKNLVPLAAAMLTEVWLSREPANQPRRHRQPRHDPDRREALSVAGLGNTGAAAQFTTFRARRDGNGLMRADGEPRRMRHGEAGNVVKLGLLRQLFLGFVEASGRRV